MESIRKLEQRTGVDVGYHNSNLHPENRHGCIGRSGIDKNYTFNQVIDIACKMNPRPNIIIKAGKNAKWYLKSFDLSKLDLEIEKQRWRDTSRATMWIVDWI